MRWVDALKIWNSEHGGSWYIPRKGTPEHSAVIAIMNGDKQSIARGDGMPKGAKAKKAGYVGLLIAAREQKKKPSDYEPEARPKKMARSFNIDKMNKFSPYVLDNYGSDALKKKMLPMRNQTVLKQVVEDGKKKLQSKTVRPKLLTHPVKQERRKKSAPTGIQMNLDEMFS